jgi:large subunit ribosomal protein L21
VVAPRANFGYTPLLAASIGWLFSSWYFVTHFVLTRLKGLDMFAIIKSGGKQYRVSEGSLVRLELLGAEVGQSIDLPVLLLGGDSVKIGKPFVDGASVKAEVVSHGKGEKLHSYRYVAKTNVRRKTGHRQPYTEVRITSIA